VEARNDILRDRRSTRGGRNPFQLWVVIACAVTGLIALLPFGTRNSAVDQYLPGLALPWYIGLLIAGGTCSVAAVWPAKTVQRLSRLLGVERVGLAILAGLLGGYGAALEVVVPKSLAGTLLLALMLASVARIRQVAREITGLHEMVQSWGQVSNEHRATIIRDLPPAD